MMSSKLSDAEQRELIDKLNKDTEEFIREKKEKNKDYKYDDGLTDDTIDEYLSTHPAFLKEQPTAEEIENNPLLQGLQQIQYDPDDSPYDKAMAHKKDGNFQFKYKKYKLARAAYTEALKAKCTDVELQAILYSNRAASNYYLQNYRSSLLDAMQAVKLAPQRVKSLLRCAQCCEKLKRFDDAINWCNILLSIDENDKMAQDILLNCKKEKKIQERDNRKAALIKQREELKEKQLLEAIKTRKIKFESTDVVEDGLKANEVSIDGSLSSGLRKVYLDDDNSLIWPVLLLYPEHETTDFIERFHESATFADVLETVFSNQADWDVHHKYLSSKLLVYYENVEYQTLYNVPLHKTLREALSHESYIVQASTPNFFVISSLSDFHKTFRSKWKNFQVRK